MEKAYNHKDIEEKIYQMWEQNGYFKPEINPKGKPFSIMLPPPNVTGTLHIGHALMLVIEDVIVRYHRMKGEKTLWLPGTDHAAIATQAKVEAELYKKENKTRYDLGREEFLSRVEDFAQKSHDTIVHQIKKMGASVDWSREAYTLDDQRNLAVRTAFKKMYDDGLIYRGETIVNWDPKLHTTVSDDEIEWKDETTSFYYLKYGPFIIGTSRPETKFGDKYVVMHPDDKRYKNYKQGQKIELEWINGPTTATIIKDEAIDMNFGTGVMTITPWHDKADYEIAKRHNLEFEQVIDFKGKLLPIAGEFTGIHIKKARALIIEKLQTKGLVEKIETNYTHRIATNYRAGGVIEPQILKQWMVDVNREFTLSHSEITGIPSGSIVTLKKLMKQVVESGQISITPSHFIKTYYHWIDNLRDWCISRQIWYGHRIPVWYRKDEMYIGVEAPEGEGWEQESDTLDTWFSSGLWTFSTLGWPQKTKDLQQFHPTSIMETGYDILFFWVARMILMSTYHTGQIPFQQVLLHGLVRDADRQKMSKSKGNVIDPLDWAEKYGTDALRIALIFSTAAGNDIPMSEDKVRGMKFFANKLWNIARFIHIKNQEQLVLPLGRGQEVSEKVHNNKTPHGEKYHQNLETLLTLATHENDKQLIQKLQTLSQTTAQNIESFNLHLAAQDLYQFIWHEFADKHIEDVKQRADPNSFLILNALFIIQLKLLHPFMPFITEEIYQKLTSSKTSLTIEKWPAK